MKSKNLYKLFGVVCAATVLTASDGWSLFFTFDSIKVAQVIETVSSARKGLTNIKEATDSLTNIQQSIGDSVSGMTKFIDKTKEAQKIKERAAKIAEYKKYLEQAQQEYEAAKNDIDIIQDNIESGIKGVEQGVGDAVDGFNDKVDDAKNIVMDPINDIKTGADQIENDIDEKVNDVKNEAEKAKAEFNKNKDKLNDMKEDAENTSRKIFGSASDVFYQNGFSSAFAAEAKEEKFVSGSTDEGNFIWSNIFATKCQLEIKDISVKTLKKCLDVWVDGMNEPSQTTRNEWIADYRSAMTDHAVADLAETLTDKVYAATFEGEVVADLDNKAKALTSERDEVAFAGNVGRVTQEVIFRLMKAQASSSITEAFDALPEIDDDYFGDDEDDK